MTSFERAKASRLLTSLLMLGALAALAALAVVAKGTGAVEARADHAARVAGGSGVGDLATVATTDAARVAAGAVVLPEVDLSAPESRAGEGELDAPRVTGRLVSPEGGAVAGADVYFGSPFGYELDPGEARTSAQSDATGHFSLIVRFAGSEDLQVRALGFVPVDLSLDSVSEPVDVGTLVLRRASRLSGRVVDASGGGVAGADIIEVDPLDDHVFRPSIGIHREVLGRSDAQGRFAVSGSAIRGHIALAAQHPQTTRGVVQVDVPEDAANVKGIVLRVERGASIRGVVEGIESDTVVALTDLSVGVVPEGHDYAVDFRYEDPTQKHVPIAADGSFEVGGLRAGEKVILAVWYGHAQGRAAWQRSASVPAVADAGAESTAELTRLSYVTPARARGVFLSPDGTPVQRAEFRSYWALVGAAPNQLSARQRTIALTDGVAYWEGWRGRPGAVDTFTVCVDGCADWSSGSVAFEPGATLDFGTVTLGLAARSTVTEASESTRALTVQLIDHAGKPFASGECALLRTDVVPAENVLIDLGEGGYARTQITTGGSYRVRRAMHSHSNPRGTGIEGHEELLEFHPYVDIPAGSDDVQVQVVVPTFASAVLKVRLDGVALPRAKVVLERVDYMREATQGEHDTDRNPKGKRTSSAGEVAYDELLPGLWRAWVYHVSLRMPESMDFELRPGANSIDLERHRNALVGRVVDARGDPIVGAIVRPLPYDSPGGSSRYLKSLGAFVPNLGGTESSAALRGNDAVLTDASGAYRLDGVLLDRDVVAYVEANGYSAGMTNPVRVAAGASIAIGDLELARGAQVDILLPEGIEGKFEIVPIVDGKKWLGADAPFPITGLVERQGNGMVRVDEVAEGEWEFSMQRAWRDGARLKGADATFVGRFATRAGERTEVDLSR